MGIFAAIKFVLNLRNLFLQNVAQTSAAPVSIQVKKASGIYITDIDGKRYLDLISGISVNNIGHRNPAVVKAVRNQCSKYMHTMVYGEHIQHPQVRLAQMLTGLLPDHLDSVYFTNSGAEATEGAMKLAKRFTGRSGIIAMKNAYHGSTQGALSLMSDEYFTAAYRPLLPGVNFINYNDQDDLDLINKETACVFVEMVQSEAGYVVGDFQFLQALQTKCREMDALLVVDEIQTGMGRTGKMFAFEHFELTPDIVLLAKGLGGGMPIGCFIANKNTMQVFTENPVLGHLTTFGGHPVNCAAAIATIGEIQSKKMMESISKKESLFRKYLVHPNIISIQGKGLMLSVDLGSERNVQNVIAHCLNKGIILDWFLFNSHSLRIAPPLIITLGEIKKVCTIILEALGSELED